jgi:hypothetical protein
MQERGSWRGVGSLLQTRAQAHVMYVLRCAAYYSAGEASVPASGRCDQELRRDLLRRMAAQPAGGRQQGTKTGRQATHHMEVSACQPVSIMEKKMLLMQEEQTRSLMSFSISFFIDMFKIMLNALTYDRKIHS